MRTRRFFRGFSPYEWETPTRDIASRTGLPEGRIMRLDTNTSPYLPVRPLRALAGKLESVGVNQYPDTSYFALRKGLSKYCSKGTDRFVVTNGADEALDIVLKTLVDPGDEVITASPTYSMFRIATEIMGGRLISVPRSGGFAVDVAKVLDAVTSRTKVILLCNPNNPSGNLTPVSDIERLAKATDAAVVVDEAYFEYSGVTSIDLTDKLENVVVVRTFSKAFSMAGARVGYLVASEGTVAELNKVRPPNSLTVISLALAEMALRDVDWVLRMVSTVVRQREKCFGRLKRIRGIEPFPSKANFILFRAEHGGDSLHERLLTKGFVLRNFSGTPTLEDCLRVTLSTPEVNDAFLAALAGAAAQ